MVLESTGTKEVLLEGFLAEKYGRNWKIKADTYNDIFACIDANYPGFRKDLIDIYLSGGDISVQVGGKFIEEAEELLHPIGKDTIIITPTPSGSKSGEAKIIVGAIILAAMFFIPGSQFAIPAFLGTEAAAAANLAIISLGVNLAIVGLQQLLAPDPSVDDNDSNYLFNGPENTTVSGNPVPILCGEMIVGGIVISSGSVGGFHANEASWVGSGNQNGGEFPEIFDTFFPANEGGSLQNSIAGQRLRVRYVGSDVV